MFLQGYQQHSFTKFVKTIASFGGYCFNYGKYMAIPLLHIYIQQEKVGTLNKGFFSYDAQWNKFPLSLSLPLSRRSFSSEECLFFQNLLPEGLQLEALTGTLIREGLLSRTAPRLALLEYIGKDMYGALQILPEEEQPCITNEYEPFDFNFNKNNSSLCLLQHDSRLRFSLAGEQYKITLLCKDNKFFLPLYGSVSSHILKFQSKQFPFVIENEFFCTKIAELLGINVHNVSLQQYKQDYCLLLQRFDRIQKENQLLRLHHEDFCQSLNLSSYEKYDCPSNEGFMGLENCFALLNKKNKEDFFNIFIFNFLIGNGDAHRKNFSSLITMQGFTLAPFYDILSTCVYPSVEKGFALALNNNFNPNNLQYKDLRILAHLALLTEEKAIVYMQHMIQHLPFAIEQVFEICHKRFIQDNKKCNAEKLLLKIQKNSIVRCKQLQKLLEHPSIQTVHIVKPH